MPRALLALSIVAFLVAALVGLFVTWDEPWATPRPADRTVDPEAAVVTPSPTEPSEEERSEAERLAWIDAEIEGRRARAEAGSWLDYDVVAARYIERQAITGRYEDFAGADEALDRAFALAPAGAGPLMRRVTLDFTLHRIDRVAEGLRRADALAVLQPDDAHTVRALSAEVAFYSGQYEQALERYEALLEESRDIETLVSLAQYRWRTGDRAAADALLTEAEALEGAPRPMRAWLCLVRALFEIDAEQWDAADAAIERGLELRPGWWQLEEHSAQVLFERGALGDARLVYEAIAARGPHPEILDALALIAAEERRTEDAAELTARAREGHETRIALFPEAAAGHGIAHYLLLEDDTARAIELAELNRDARPFGESESKLAIAYARAGRWDDALAIVYRLEGTPWSTPESHAISAIVFEHTGDAARASEHRAQATAFAPGAIERVTAMLR